MLLGGGGDDVYFYPRPPCGGRLSWRYQVSPDTRISIHALRVEGDTAFRAAFILSFKISIHALRVEGDGLFRRNSFLLSRYFYPRPPCGGRLKSTSDILTCKKISIHALRVEGDFDRTDVFNAVLISIHALRVEGDGSTVAM